VSGAVVKLPTAAPRQVRQPQNREGRAARVALHKGQGRAFPYVNHTIREAQQIATAISPMTPERWLLLAMLNAMPADQFEKLAAFGTHGHPAIRGLMKLAKAKVGLSLDVMDALSECDQ